MADLAPFPNTARVVAAVLRDLVGSDDTHIGGSTPPNLQSMMPFIRVERTGGADDGVTDTATIAIDTFKADLDDSFALAQAVLQRLTSGPKTVNGIFAGIAVAGTIDKATTQSGPTVVAWSGDPSVSRHAALYRVTVRRPSPTP